jgi:ribose-phosphate pyrophosphokinase
LTPRDAGENGGSAAGKRRDEVFAACTHPVLSGPAVERIAKSKIEEVVVTDSVPLSEAAQKLDKIKVLSVAPLLARGIQSIHEETSISELFI